MTKEEIENKIALLAMRTGEPYVLAELIDQLVTIEVNKVREAYNKLDRAKRMRANLLKHHFKYRPDWHFNYFKRLAKLIFHYEQILGISYATDSSVSVKTGKEGNTAPETQTNEI